MVIEMPGVENGELAVPVNNILVRNTAFLAADTWPCVLIHHLYFCSTGILRCLKGFKNNKVSYKIQRCVRLHIFLQKCHKNYIIACPACVSKKL